MKMLMLLEFDLPEDDPYVIPKLAQTVSSLELPHLKNAHLAINDRVSDILDLLKGD